MSLCVYVSMSVGVRNCGNKVVPHERKVRPARHSRGIDISIRSVKEKEADGGSATVSR